MTSQNTTNGTSHYTAPGLLSGSFQRASRTDARFGTFTDANGNATVINEFVRMAVVVLFSGLQDQVDQGNRRSHTHSPRNATIRGFLQEVTFSFEEISFVAVMETSSLPSLISSLFLCRQYEY